MREHPLSPYVTVRYFRNSRVGLIKVRESIDEVDATGKADFAIVGIYAPDARAPRHDVRFEMPFESEKLAAFLSAVTVAYSLGHFDRANRLRKAMNLSPLPIHQVPNLARTADDRD